MPENFDTVEKGSGWRLMAGANDWENGHTAMAVITTDGDGNSRRIWAVIDNPGADAEDDRDGQAKETGERAVAQWLHTARRLQKEYREENGYETSWLDIFQKALTDPEMKPYVESHGQDKTNWADVRETMEKPADLPGQVAPSPGGIGYNELYDAACEYVEGEVGRHDWQANWKTFKSKHVDLDQLHTRVKKWIDYAQLNVDAMELIRFIDRLSTDRDGGLWL